MRPPERTVLPPAPARTVPTASVSAPPVEAEDAPPPPRRRRQAREQLNSKIRSDLRERLNTFVRAHDSTVQDVLEAALEEYMTRRGWPS